MAVPVDLIDAVIQVLEANTGVTQAFGDTWNQAAQTGVAKFFVDVADQVPMPYAVLQEAGENYEYMTRGHNGINFTTPGSQIMVDIWNSNRFSLRELGFLIARALNDADLRWPDENNTMYFRLTRSSYVPTGETAPGAPVAFHRVFFFEYSYSGLM